MTVQAAAQVPAAGVSLVTTAETVAAVLALNAESLPGGGGITLSGYLNITPGTAATAVTIRVRQGGTTAGALVGTADVANVAAAVPISIPFGQVFPGGQLPPYGNQFCVTVQQTAATGNGTVNDGQLVMDSVSVTG